MSSRKRTIDQDDIDDEDGTLEQEAAEENDLTLVVKSAEEVVTGDPDEPEEEREEEV